MSYERTAIIQNESGIHARVAAGIVQRAKELAAKYGTHLYLRGERGERFELHSIMKLIALTETDGMPDIDSIAREQAWWSYIVIWRGMDMVSKTSDEQLKKMYADKRVLTADDVRLPDGWEDEPIARAFPFRLPEFLDEMRGDFAVPEYDGPYAVFTPDFADEFIRRAAEAMVREIDALRHGETTIDEEAFTWGKMK